MKTLFGSTSYAAVHPKVLTISTLYMCRLLFLVSESDNPLDQIGKRICALVGNRGRQFKDKKNGNIYCDIYLCEKKL